MHVYTLEGLEIFPSCLSLLCRHIRVVVFDGGRFESDILEAVGGFTRPEGPGEERTAKVEKLQVPCHSPGAVSRAFSAIQSFKVQKSSSQPVNLLQSLDTYVVYLKSGGRDSTNHKGSKTC